MDGDALQERLADVLIGRVRQDRFPSPTLMNRIEGSLRTREQVEEWAEVLIEKIESTRFPSRTAIDRVEAALARLQ
jgi:hypothetical protein